MDPAGQVVETLPDDLLIDIFRRLDPTAVIRCAGACRPWRHAIINNASYCFRPRPGRFFPDLLLGFLEKDRCSNRLANRIEYLPWQLQYVPAPNTAPPDLFTETEGTSGASVVVDGKVYSDLLSSRDGFLLLGDEDGKGDRLCLCNAQTGICKILPAAAVDNCSGSWRCSMYVLATGYDVVVDGLSMSDDGDETAPAVWILAVQCGDSKNGITYQIFSPTSGAWGPVKRSAKFPEDVVHAYTDHSPYDRRDAVVVCHGAVSWFVRLDTNRHVLNQAQRLCMFSLHVRTGRTRTMELPKFSFATEVRSSLVLAVSEDGRLSLVRMMPFRHQMEVWVLVGDGRWTLRRTIDNVERLLPNCPITGNMELFGFCPRSGYLFGTGRDDQRVLHHFVIGVDGSSPRLMGTVESRRPSSSRSAFRFPYEMDWSAYISSYISKMKHF